MRLILLNLTLLAALAFGQDDSGCTELGGQCLDWRYYICHAGWEVDVCLSDSDVNYKCCLPCDAECKHIPNILNILPRKKIFLHFNRWVARRGMAGQWWWWMHGCWRTLLWQQQLLWWVGIFFHSLSFILFLTIFLILVSMAMKPVEVLIADNAADNLLLKVIKWLYLYLGIMNINFLLLKRLSWYLYKRGMGSQASNFNFVHSPTGIDNLLINMNVHAKTFVFRSPIGSCITVLVRSPPPTMIAPRRSGASRIITWMSMDGRTSDTGACTNCIW